LQAEPNNSDMLHLLGVIAIRVDKYEAAFELISNAIRINPAVPHFYNSLGNVLNSQKKFQQAIDSFQRALALQSDYPEAHNNLGNAFMALAQFDQAINAYQQALTLKPDFIEAYNNLGKLFNDQQQYELAVETLQRALALNPHFAQAYNNLGNALSGQGQTAEAITAYERAIQLNPNESSAHCNLGKTFNEQGQWAQAITCFQKAIAVNAHDAEAYSNLGYTLIQTAQLREALACLQQAIALNPNEASVHNQLGTLLKNQGQLAEAMGYFQRAIALNPDSAEAHNNLATAFKDQGRFEEAIAHYRRTLEIDPIPLAYSNLLLCINYVRRYDQAAIFLEHQQFNTLFCESLCVTPEHFEPLLHSVTSERKIKLGYVSADFRKHPVAYFIEPVLAHHDHERFEIFCYHNAQESDEFTVRLQAYADHWFNCFGTSDALLVEQIKADQIDILIDLSGHTANNRLLVFARKPAPIQITYLGYPNTTGLSAIDYRITDGYMDPKGHAEAFNSENLLRMPGSYFCFRPNAQSPAVNPTLPVLTKGYITFSSLNNYAKLNGELLALWAEVLHAVPNSRLLLKTKSLNDQGIKEALIEQFAQLNIESERLILLGRSPSPAHLNTYHEVDIALDSYPFTGGTTTFEALWMGIPVVSLVGKRQVARQGLSILSALELQELIAYSPEDYINICVKLAENTDQLQALRRNLRERMQESSLMDETGFTQHLENVYQTLFQSTIKI
jgi:protein O-GlcNAc transferase